MSLLLLFRPSSSPDITVSATAGVLNLTATAPTPGESFAATVGTLVLSGLDSSLSESVPVDAGILVLNGPPPTVTGADAGTTPEGGLVFPYHYYHWAQEYASLGGDAFFGKVRSRTSGSGVGTNAGVTVTLSAPSGNLAYTCTGIQASGDAAAVVTIESPANTVLYRKRFAAAFTLSESFPVGGLKGALTSAMLVKVSASTSNCEANIQAFVGG